MKHNVFFNIHYLYKVYLSRTIYSELCDTPKGWGQKYPQKL